MAHNRFADSGIRRGTVAPISDRAILRQIQSDQEGGDNVQFDHESDQFSESGAIKVTTENVVNQSESDAATLRALKDQREALSVSLQAIREAGIDEKNPAILALLGKIGECDDQIAAIDPQARIAQAESDMSNAEVMANRAERNDAIIMAHEAWIASLNVPNVEGATATYRLSFTDGAWRIVIRSGNRPRATDSEKYDAGIEDVEDRINKLITKTVPSLIKRSGKSAPWGVVSPLIGHAIRESLGRVKNVPADEIAEYAESTMNDAARVFTAIRSAQSGTVQPETDETES